jgi:hypothetical protein
MQSQRAINHPQTLSTICINYRFSLFVIRQKEYNEYHLVVLGH